MSTYKMIFVYTVPMRGSIILFGSTQNNRHFKAVEIINNVSGKLLNWNYFGNIPDIKIVELLEDKKTIGIDQIREGIKFLAEKPLNYPLKVLVIDKADNMTIEAQNALLKTLEETPKHALILMLTRAENSMLPTVVSRSRKIRCMPGEHEESAEQPAVKFSGIFDASPGERLDLIESISKEERDDVIELIDTWLEEGRNMMKKLGEDPGARTELATLLERIYNAQNDLEKTNVGIKSCLEWALLGKKVR